MPCTSGSSCRVLWGSAKNKFTKVKSNDQSSLKISHFYFLFSFFPIPESQNIFSSFPDLTGAYGIFFLESSKEYINVDLLSVRSHA